MRRYRVTYETRKGEEKAVTVEAENQPRAWHQTVTHELFKNGGIAASLIEIEDTGPGSGHATAALSVEEERCSW